VKVNLLIEKKDLEKNRKKERKKKKKKRVSKKVVFGTKTTSPWESGRH
jgi:hypothetical protein